MTETGLRTTLKAERKRQNKSRLQVARRAGVCENTVLAFENHPKYNTTLRGGRHSEGFRLSDCMDT